jgi:hypothetical protein
MSKSAETAPVPAKRANYAGLAVPFGLVIVALVAWTFWWFSVSSQLETQTDKTAANMRRAGYAVSWSARSVSGWPFRTYIKFDDLRVVTPSGDTITSPELGAEAQTYQLGKWVLAAPQGLTLTRKDKGAVQVSGEALRASLVGLGGPNPRLAVELRKPVFTPAAGAEPFPLASAETIDFYLEPRPAPASGADPHEARFLFRLVDAKARSGSPLDLMADAGAISTQWEGVITRADALRGSTWADAVKRWSEGGGTVTEVKAEAHVGKAVAMASSPRLSVGADGRLLGVVELDLLKGGPGALLALGRSGKVDSGAAAAAAATTALQGGFGGGKAHVELEFGPDGSLLGPLRLAPAPKVF